MEAPIEFITADENDQLEVNPKALELLRQVDKCLIPVAIVGTYRTGKSYLLNRLMEQNNGFPLGSTVQSKTKGIWMWLRDHPKDESKALLLLDTEGLDDAEKGNKGHDANIFTLAVLLCSVLIYNSKGVIDSSALDGLHLATELTEHIRVKSTKSGGYDKFSKDVEDMVKQYTDSPITMGPAKNGVLVEFTKKKIGGLRNLIMNADNSMKKEKKIQEELRLNAEQVEKENKEQQECIKKIKAHNEKQDAMHEENMRKLRVDVKKSHEAEMKKVREEVEQKNKEVGRLRQEGMNEQADMMKELVKGLMKMMTDMEEARAKSDKENKETYKELMLRFVKEPIKTAQEKTDGSCSIS